MPEPRAMNISVFLDDVTLDELRGQLPVPIRIVHGAADIVASVLG